MSQPPYSPYEPEPYSGRPSSGAGGYPPPGVPQQPPGYEPPQRPPSGGVYGSPSSGGGVYGTPVSGGGYGSPASGEGYGPPVSGGGYPPPGGAPQYNTGPQYNPAANNAGTAYGAPPPAGPPQFNAPPKKKNKALRIVLIVVAVIAVLCVGGIGVAFFAAKDKVAQVVDATKITVVEPETLGGRAKVTDPNLQASVSELDNELSKAPGATGSVGAAYGDLKKQDVVMVVAASSISGSAESRFKEFTTGMSQGGTKVNNFTDVDPGPLGGIAKCGDTKESGVPMAICVWSDNGSIGMFAMLFKEKADLQKEFVAMRGQVEQKS